MLNLFFTKTNIILIVSILIMILIIKSTLKESMANIIKRKKIGNIMEITFDDGSKLKTFLNKKMDIYKGKETRILSEKINSDNSITKYFANGFSQTFKNINKNNTRIESVTTKNENTKNVLNTIKKHFNLINNNLLLEEIIDDSLVQIINHKNKTKLIKPVKSKIKYLYKLLDNGKYKLVWTLGKDGIKVFSNGKKIYPDGRIQLPNGKIIKNKK